MLAKKGRNEIVIVIFEQQNDQPQTILKTVTVPVLEEVVRILTPGFFSAVFLTSHWTAGKRALS